MSDLLQNLPKQTNGLLRKRVRNTVLWKREQDRRKRYTPTHLPTLPTCGHNTNIFKCSTLNMEDLLIFHGTFYKEPNKLKQDNFILNHSRTSPCKRVRRRNSDSNIKRSMAVQYFVTKLSPRKEINVCKAAFLSILGLKKDRVANVIKRSWEFAGSSPIERRGGDRRSSLSRQKRIVIHEYIQTFKTSEPHYCQSKRHQRVYLDAQLNIKKMWRMFNSQTENVKVKESLFRNVFNTEFNIGFGSPRGDVCFRCTTSNEKIKNSSIPMVKKQNEESCSRPSTLTLGCNAVMNIKTEVDLPSTEEINNEMDIKIENFDLIDNILYYENAEQQDKAIVAERVHEEQEEQFQSKSNTSPSSLVSPTTFHCMGNESFPEYRSNITSTSLLEKICLQLQETGSSLLKVAETQNKLIETQTKLMKRSLYLEERNLALSERKLLLEEKRLEEDAKRQELLMTILNCVINK